MRNLCSPAREATNVSVLIAAFSRGNATHSPGYTGSETEKRDFLYLGMLSRSLDGLMSRYNSIYMPQFANACELNWGESSGSLAGRKETSPTSDDLWLRQDMRSTSAIETILMRRNCCPVLRVGPLGSSHLPKCRSLAQIHPVYCTLLCGRSNLLRTLQRCNCGPQPSRRAS